MITLKERLVNLWLKWFCWHRRTVRYTSIVNGVEYHRVIREGKDG